MRRDRPEQSSQSSTITAFQRRVYAVVAQIPKGRVMTYQGVAWAVGCGSCQAIGMALKHNPFSPLVPCHRVIKTDLTPGGFFGARTGGYVVRKLALLAEEGVFFDKGRLQNSALILDHPGQEALDGA